MASKCKLNIYQKQFNTSTDNIQLSITRIGKKCQVGFSTNGRGKNKYQEDNSGW